MGIPLYIIVKNSCLNKKKLTEQKKAVKVPENLVNVAPWLDHHNMNLAPIASGLIFVSLFVLFYFILMPYKICYG